MQIQEVHCTLHHECGSQSISKATYLIQISSLFYLQLNYKPITVGLIPDAKCFEYKMWALDIDLWDC